MRKSHGTYELSQPVDEVSCRKIVHGEEITVAERREGAGRRGEAGMEGSLSLRSIGASGQSPSLLLSSLPYLTYTIPHLIDPGDDRYVPWCIPQCYL